MTLSPASFAFVQDVLRSRSAHQLEDDKAYLVETRLLAVARRHGFDSVEGLVLRLRAHADERLLAEIVDAMTINETFFFRDGRPFDALRDHVFPDLIQRRSALRTLNVWCAGCSSGQEPYSIAMLLHRCFPELANWRVEILASDISDVMLERARKGRYGAVEVSRGLAPEYLHAFFKKEKNGWRIADEVRRQVRFFGMNLSGVWPVLPRMDLILLRNVLIYFDLPTRRRILQQVRQTLQPDGYLLLGGAETTHNVVDSFEVVSIGGGTFFRPLT